MSTMAVTNPTVLRAAGGTLTALSPGVSSLSAFFSGLSDTRTVRVTTANDPIVSIAFSPPNLTLPVMGSAQVQLLGTTQSGQTVDLSNDPMTVLSQVGGVDAFAVPGGILVTGLGSGPAQVTATYQGLSATLPVLVTGGTTIVALQIIAPSSLLVGTTGSMSVIALMSDGSVNDVTFDPALTITSTSGAVAVMPGLVIALQPGVGVIDVMLGGQFASTTVTGKKARDTCVGPAVPKRAERSVPFAGSSLRCRYATTNNPCKRSMTAPTCSRLFMRPSLGSRQDSWGRSRELVGRSVLSAAQPQKRHRARAARVELPRLKSAFRRSRLWLGGAALPLRLRC